jgi:hypothetical protein
MTDHMAALITAWSALVTAVAAGGAAFVGLWAATSWRHALEFQRADECIAAAHDLRGAVVRLLRLHEIGETKLLEPAYSEVWACHRRLARAAAIAGRYHAKLDRAEIEAMHDRMLVLGGLVRPAQQAPDLPAARELATTCDTLVRRIEAVLAP